MYLCAIRDGHSRRVLGHVVADHIGADMVCQAIDTAVACRGGGAAGTVLHSDRGGEFTAALTMRACGRHKLKRSMGETGICRPLDPRRTRRCGRPRSGPAPVSPAGRAVHARRTAVAPLPDGTEAWPRNWAPVPAQGITGQTAPIRAASSARSAGGEIGRSRATSVPEAVSATNRATAAGVGTVSPSR